MVTSTFNLISCELNRNQSFSICLCYQPLYSSRPKLTLFFCSESTADFSRETTFVQKSEVIRFSWLERRSEGMLRGDKVLHSHTFFCQEFKFILLMGLRFMSVEAAVKNVCILNYCMMDWQNKVKIKISPAV